MRCEPVLLIEGFRVMRENILLTVKDLVDALLNTDRRDDEELQRGEIEKAIENNEVSVDEIVDRFKSELIRVLDNN